MPWHSIPRSLYSSSDFIGPLNFELSRFYCNFFSDLDELPLAQNDNRLPDHSVNIKHSYNHQGRDNCCYSYQDPAFNEAQIEFTPGVQQCAFREDPIQFTGVDSKKNEKKKTFTFRLRKTTTAGHYYFSTKLFLGCMMACWTFCNLTSNSLFLWKCCRIFRDCRSHSFCRSCIMANIRPGPVRIWLALISNKLA